MFTRLFTTALFAGAIAGVLAAVLQLMFVQPVLLHAELYESGQLVHFGGEANSAHPDLPGFDVTRDGLSIIFTMIIYSAYALILVAAMDFAAQQGAKINARTGLLWGVAGFVIVHLAPAFSLPPEVPGVAAVDVFVRQIWWACTVGASAVALWLIAFGKSWMAWGPAVILLLAPHIIGAPEPDQFAGPVPTELGALFAARALGVGLAAWVMTGALAGYFWQGDASQAEDG